jgi:hypothetical protein
MASREMVEILTMLLPRSQAEGVVLFVRIFQGVGRVNDYGQQRLRVAPVL